MFQQTSRKISSPILPFSGSTKIDTSVFLIRFSLEPPLFQMEKVTKEGGEMRDLEFGVVWNPDVKGIRRGRADGDYLSLDEEDEDQTWVLMNSIRCVCVCVWERGGGGGGPFF